jgi:predicted metal-dependent enzyme (double-stranded beta helix superfamily)
VSSATVAGGLSVRDLCDLVRELADDRERWVALVRHDPHQRGVALLLRDDQVEVWVLSWMPGQDTGYHDHGGSAAAICVTEGKICEERLSFGGPPRGQTLDEDEIGVVPALHIHRVYHAGSVPSVSIHAYSPPLGDVGTYTADAEGLIERRVQPGDHELLP